MRSRALGQLPRDRRREAAGRRLSPARMSDAFKPLLARLADGATLSEKDAGEFFAACLRGEPTPAQVGAALTAMRMRAETLGEIVACARAMRKAAIRIAPPFPTIDVC